MKNAKIKITFFLIALLILLELLILIFPVVFRQKIKLDKSNFLYSSNVLIKEQDGEINAKVIDNKKEFCIQINNILNKDGTYEVLVNVDTEEVLKNNFASKNMGDGSLLYFMEGSKTKNGTEIQATNLAKSKFLLFAAFSKEKKMGLNFDLKYKSSKTDGCLKIACGGEGNPIFLDTLTNIRVYWVNIDLLAFLEKFLFLFLIIFILFFVFLHISFNQKKQVLIFAIALMIIFSGFLELRSRRPPNVMDSNATGLEGDNCLNFYTGESIFYGGKIELTDFYKIRGFENLINGNLVLENGKVFNYFPMGAGVSYLPIILFSRIFKVHSENIVPYENANLFLYTNLSLILFFLISFQISKNARKSFILALIFLALITPFVFTTFWSNNIAVFNLLLGIFLIKQGEKKKKDKLIILSIIPVSFLFFCRPATVGIILMFLLYIVLKHKKCVFYYIFGGGIFLSSFFFVSYLNYGNLLPSYYRQPIFLNQYSFSFWDKMLGLVASPSRSPFVFVPIFIFVFLELLKKTEISLEKMLAYSFFVYFIQTAVFNYWTFGTCYGARAFWDLLPVFLLSFYPFFDKLFYRAINKRELFLKILIVLAISFSCFFQTRPYYSYKAAAWNKEYFTNKDYRGKNAMEKIMSIKNSQAFYGIEDDIKKLFRKETVP